MLRNRLKYLSIIIIVGLNSCKIAEDKLSYNPPIFPQEYIKRIYNQLLLNILRAISQKYGHNL